MERSKSLPHSKLLKNSKLGEDDCTHFMSKIVFQIILFNRNVYLVWTQ